MKEAFLDGLDLQGLEDMCIRKSFDSITVRQIQLLQEALSKAKDQTLGVEKSRQKENQKN